MNRLRLAALALIIPIILGLSVASAAALQLSGSLPTQVVISRCADTARITTSTPVDGWVDVEVRTASGCANLPYVLFLLDESGQPLSAAGSRPSGSPVPAVLDAAGSVTVAMTDFDANRLGDSVLTVDTWPVPTSRTPAA